ncbi:MAG TPA: hypothetical protein VGH27_28540 [Streptosporangiaceae bacterium]
MPDSRLLSGSDGAGPGPGAEVPLGGAISGAVRVGATVRWPAVPAAEALLTFLESAGFDGAPRYLGRDATGRSVLSWVAGARSAPRNT